MSTTPKLPDGFEWTQTLSRSETTLVVRAKDLARGSIVVLKTPTEQLDLTSAAAIDREYETLCRLDGVGNVRALTRVVHERRSFIVMENFERSLEGLRPSSVHAFLDLAIGAAGALAAVHACGVVHGDIAPGNLLLREQDVRLTDFGLSAHRDAPTFAVPRSAACGTLPYMSPEQTGRVGQAVDERSDLYGLGAVLFEQLTGTPPFQANDALGFVHCHLSEPAPDPCARAPQTPALLGRIVLRLLAKDPSDRYQTARGLQADLEECRRQWTERGDISDFELGMVDRARSLGRVDALFERSTALDVFAAGLGQPLLEVVGRRGIGKSALLDRAAQAATSRGLWVRTRCDARTQSVPLAALHELGEQIARWLLMLPQAELVAWKARLEDALGLTTALLCNLVPGFRGVVEATATLPELPPREAAARQAGMLETLARVLTESTPLYLVFDDAQHLDPTTARALGQLARAPGLEDFTVVVAHDGSSGTAVEELDPSVTIELAPLSVDGVVGVLQRLLRTPSGHEVLAKELHDLTGGLPEAVIATVQYLHRDGGLHFDVARTRWTFDAAALARAPVSEDVAEHLLQRLEGLEDVLGLLESAACCGPDFEVEELSALVELPSDVVEEGLFNAAMQNVVMLGERWSFTYPRLREILHARMDPDRRARTHARLGRQLLERDDHAKYTFEIADHLAQSIGAASPDADVTLASSCLEAAGRRALAASAYEHAAQLFEDALGLADRVTQGNAAHRFELAMASAEASLLAGDLDRAEARAEALTARAHGRLSTARAHVVRAAATEVRGQLVETLAILREGLVHLGIELPSDPSELESAAGRALERMQSLLAQTPIDAIPSLPEMTDALHLARMDLLMRAVPAAYQTDPNSFLLVELTMFEETLQHGVSAAACKMLADCGIILLNVFGDRERALALGDAATALVERLGSSAAAVSFIGAAFLSHWRSTPEEIAEKLQRTFELGVQEGDIMHAAFAKMMAATLELHAGLDLGRTEAALRACEDYGHTVGSTIHETWSRAIAPRVACLRSSSTESSPAPAGAMPAGTSPAASEAQARIVIELFVGDTEAAWAFQQSVEAHAQLIAGFFTDAPHLCLGVILRAARFGALDDETRARTLEEMEKTIGTLASWSEANPAWFEAFHAVAQAEYTRVRGASLDEVVEAYERVGALGGAEWLHLRGWAAEQYGRFWLERGSDRIASGLLQDACELYARWGATRRVEMLRAEFGGLVDRTTASRPGFHSTVSSRTQLDIESVLKATSSISSEVRGDALHLALMRTLIESAGAQRGVLILPTREGLEVTLRTTRSSSTPATQPVDDAEDLSRRVVHYVSRTQETVVLDHAADDPTFGRDPYVARHGVRSLLCAPILHHGELQAIVYLENNAIPRAFSASRLKMVHLIAGQAAVSLRNALLYADLEERVAERTRELAERARETEALFNALPLGVFTVDETLTIESRYSPKLTEILGDEAPAGKDACAVLFRDSSVGAEQRTTHQSALQMTFGAPEFLAEMNWPHLITDLERTDASGARRALEIDWAPIADDAGNVGRALAAVRDVTELRALRRSVEESERQGRILQQILGAGAEAFERFAKASEAQLAECTRLVERDARLRGDALERVFRNLHTIKGNARSLGLSDLSAVVHEVEEPYARMRASTDGETDRERLLADLQMLEANLGEYTYNARERLGGSVDGGRYRTLVDELRDVLSSSPHAETLARARSLLERFDAEPLWGIVDAVACSLGPLASELGKPSPRVEHRGDAPSLHAAFEQPIRSALNHAFRNALDHGIESPPDRERAGKPARGTITLTVERHAAGATLIIEDDGRGLRMDRLRALRPDARDPQEVADQVFDAGTSTADRVTHVSGRGVGLNAVRAFLQERGGDARIVLRGAESAGLQPFALVLDLPLEALLDDDATPRAIAS